MSWLALVLLRSVALSCLEVTWKVFLGKHKSPILVIAFWTSIIPAAILAPYVIYHQQYEALASGIYLKAIFANVGLNIGADLLLFYMIRKYDVSYISALSATSPLFYLTFGWLFLGENLPPEIIILIIAIVSGGLLLELSRKEKHNSLMDLVKSSSFIHMLGYILLTSLSTVASKIAITNGPVEGYIAVRYALLALGFLALSWLLPALTKSARQGFFKKEYAKLSVAGLFLTFAVMFEMYAYAIAEIALVDALTKITLIFTFILEYILIKRVFNRSRILAIFITMLSAAGIVLIR